MGWKERLARQIAIFGEAGMTRIRGSTLAVVGLGGNGSAFTLFAALVGFKSFYLVDFDVLEESNLNRFLCGGYEDVGCLKVDVVKERIKAIEKGTRCWAIAKDIKEPEGLRALHSS